MNRFLLRTRTTASGREEPNSSTVPLAVVMDLRMAIMRLSMYRVSGFHIVTTVLHIINHHNSNISLNRVLKHLTDTSQTKSTKIIVIRVMRSTTQRKSRVPSAVVILSHSLQNAS
jgi:hypothetical protein